MRHLIEVVVDSIEAGFVFQTEHEDDGIDPGCELEQKDVDILRVTIQTWV